MIALVPMDAVAYEAFVRSSLPLYAAEKVAAGQWAPDEALTLSRQVHDELLPAGLATPGHHLYRLVMQADHPAGTPGGTQVGTLWIAEQLRGANRVAYMYDLFIEPAHRRQGHALAAFTALEAQVQALGLRGIALHVFGHNAAAQALYLRLGYHATNINMFKALAPAPT